MKYKDKVQAKLNPFKYDVDSKTFQMGAWRHWDQHLNRDGDLTRVGEHMVDNDRAFLSRRFRVGQQEFVPA